MIITIGHDRVPKVLWGTGVPGAQVWLGGETSTSLDPDGCVVRRYDATATESTEDTDASETANERVDAMQHTSAKKRKRCVRGEVYLLTRSLLMGVYTVMRPRRLAK